MSRLGGDGQTWEPILPEVLRTRGIERSPSLDTDLAQEDASADVVRWGHDGARRDGAAG